MLLQDRNGVGLELRVLGLEERDTGDPTWVRFEAVARAGPEDHRTRFSLVDYEAAELAAFLRDVAQDPSAHRRTEQYLDDPIVVYARGGSDAGVTFRISFPGEKPTWAQGQEDGWWWIEFLVQAKEVAAAAQALWVDVPMTSMPK